MMKYLLEKSDYLYNAHKEYMKAQDSNFCFYFYNEIINQNFYD